MRKKAPGLIEWYDKLSSNYDELYGREQSGKHQRVLELIMQQGLGLVVDVACGNGGLLQNLRGGCKYGVGVDLSGRMLRAAKRKLKFDNVDLVRADCQSIPLRGGVADLTLAISLLEQDPEAGRRVSELARVTKPAGILIITVFHPEGVRSDPKQLGLEHVRHRAELSNRETLFQVQNLGSD